MNTDPRIITFNELRRMVGWLGILLPFMLAIMLFVLASCSIQDSISQYYYTRMGSYLTGTLCAVGLFLFAYKGYPGENDGKYCNFAAVCALGVAFIPMQLNPTDVPSQNCIVFFTKGEYLWRYLHYVFAVLLFCTMAFLCYFKFTLTTPGEKVAKPSKKYTRNQLFKLCGIIIFSSIVLLAIYKIIVSINHDYKVNTLTFFLESIMLIAFGTAWLVKGKGVSFLND